MLVRVHTCGFMCMVRLHDRMVYCLNGVACRIQRSGGPITLFFLRRVTLLLFLSPNFTVLYPGSDHSLMRQSLGCQRRGTTGQIGLLSTTSGVKALKWTFFHHESEHHESEQDKFVGNVLEIRFSLVDTSRHAPVHSIHSNA